MIEHLVIFKLKPESTDAQRQEVVTRLRGLRDLIPDIIELTAGFNTSDRSQGFEVGLFVRLPSHQALETYRNHPAHLSAVDEAIKPVLTDLIVVDYET